MTTTTTTATTTTRDPLAIPATARAHLDQLDAGRLSRIAHLHAAAREAHEGRCAAARVRFMNGEDMLDQYRAAIRASEERLAAALADVPPAVDLDLLGARVEARALDAVAGWWADELDAARRQQEAWAPADGDGAEGAAAGEGDHAAA